MYVLLNLQRLLCKLNIFVIHVAQIDVRTNDVENNQRFSHVKSTYLQS